MPITDTEHALLDRVATLRDQLIGWTADLVAIPTVNPYSGDASAASEAPGQDWFEDRCRSLGASVRRVPVPPDVYAQGGVLGPQGRSWDDRENVVAEWTLGPGKGPRILINNHMDTVGTAGMECSPYDPQIRDGRMWGRGTSDTKGNLVAGLIAVEALREQPGLNGTVVFESVVDEECNGSGAGTLACCLAGVTGDVAICLDGPSDVLHIACNGIATVRIIVRGMAGHSSTGQSVNAIDKAIFVKQAVDAFGRRYAERFPHCGLNVGIFRAGTLPAIVPGEAELQANMNYDIRDAEQAETEGAPWGGSVFRRRFEQDMAALADQDPWFRDKPPEVAWIKELFPGRRNYLDVYDHHGLCGPRAVFGHGISTKTTSPGLSWFITTGCALPEASRTVSLSSTSRGATL